MGKFILFALSCAISMLSYSQTGVREGNMFFSTGGGAGDTLTASATKAYPVYFEGSDLLRYRIQVEEDSISGTPAFSSYLQGSLDNSTWTDIDTVVVSTGVDSTFSFVNTTGVDYKFLRIANIATATAQKSTVRVRWLFLNK